MKKKGLLLFYAAMRHVPHIRYLRIFVLYRIQPHYKYKHYSTLLNLVKIYCSFHCSETIMTFPKNKLLEGAVLAHYSIDLGRIGSERMDPFTSMGVTKRETSLRRARDGYIPTLQNALSQWSTLVLSCAVALCLSTPPYFGVQRERGMKRTCPIQFRVGKSSSKPGTDDVTFLHLHTNRTIASPSCRKVASEH